MPPRVRFAPSPTGNVHIGNIRVAIFNWLFARHNGGHFLLRVEDTDRERSTPEAIRNLLEVLDWLKLDCDEAPFYQSQAVEVHRQAADSLVEAGHAIRLSDDDGGQAVRFRIPFNVEGFPEIQTDGPAEIAIHPDQPVSISLDGVSFAGVSKKGKAVPQAGCLAGFRHLEVLADDGTALFRLDDHIEAIFAGEPVVPVSGGTRINFTRRSVGFVDQIKGELRKPLDTMKDLIIVRTDGSPVFHLANVCDDAEQRVTDIIRGDDHVESTYRHLLLYRALGLKPPRYAHLPMVVNRQGKPYSKRDGDAFVGDFRAKGYLSDALFNYLALLGWSPGDDREKLTREEMVAAFTLERVQESAAQMDLRKLDNLNGHYVAELPFEMFLKQAHKAAVGYDWYPGETDPRFAKVAKLLQSRTKKLTDVADWGHFFCDLPSYDEKAARKTVGKPGIGAALADLANRLADCHWDAGSIEAVVRESTQDHEIPEGKLNQPLRVAATGSTIGAGIFETLELLPKSDALKRLRYAAQTYGDLD